LVLLRDCKCGKYKYLWQPVEKSDFIYNI